MERFKRTMQMRITKFLKILLCVSLVIRHSFSQEGRSNISINQQEKYPKFIHQELNFFEFNNRKTIDNLKERWEKNKGNFVVAHFGDSHVQPDYFTGAVRRSMQEMKGDGGRGMIFPYSIAKTYSQSDYSSSFEGKWITGNSIQIPPRLPVGVSGFAAYTSDKNAAFSISFKSPLSSGEKILKIFCDKEKSGYLLKILSGNESHDILLDTLSTKTPYLQVVFKKLSDNITFRLSKDLTDEKTFKLHGISIENKTSGVIYHNLGVGGACFSALNYQKNFDKEFPYLQADLVICDWGGNDFMYKNRIEPELEEIMVQTIKKIRHINPDAAILIPSAQDINKKGKNVTAAKQYAALARKVALENNCLFYDWFVISGGPKSMFLWSESGIAGKDNVHLNAKGYTLKGELFTEAFINSIQYLDRNRDLQNLIFDNQSYYIAGKDSTSFEVPQQKEIANKKNNKTKKITQNKKPRIIYHKVKKGETLSVVARKYKTTISKIKSANSINGNRIRTGQILMIN